MAGPYSARFGAIHHEDDRNFLFTVAPASSAVEVANAMNTAHAANQPGKSELTQWRENVTSLLAEPDPDVIRAHEGGGPEDLILSLVLTMARTRNMRDTALGLNIEPKRPMTEEEEAALIVAMCKAHDREESAQKGEPSPWREDLEKDPDWEQERFLAMREAFDAAKAGLAGASLQAAPGGWIVSNGNADLWRTWVDGCSVWTDVRANAVRYARREDAEAAHAEDEAAWRIEPFVALSPPAPEAETRPFPVEIERWPREEDADPDISPDEVAAVLALSAKPWVLVSVSRALKDSGMVFPAKTETEMAVALHWLLVHVLTPGTGGLDTASDRLNEIAKAGREKLSGTASGTIVGDGLEEG